MERTNWLTNISNKSLLREAFTHRSYLNEVKDSRNSNERLEFLGDAVLELIISHYLYSTYSAFPEGKLTLIRSSIVKTQSLAKAATLLHLGDQLLLSKGEEENNGRTNMTILANTYEAFLGALYVDAGYTAAKEFVYDTLVPVISEIVRSNTYFDAKSNLQELIQERFKITPIYKVLHEEGPDHKKLFTVGVYMNDRQLGKGTGKSKQLAEDMAAKNALELISQ